MPDVFHQMQVILRAFSILLPNKEWRNKNIARMKLTIYFKKGLAY